MDRKDVPLIGVGAIVFRGEEVLLIRRGKPPFEGLWSIPGGKLQLGESIAEAVRREVREETAVEIRLLGLIGVFEALPKLDPRQTRHIVMVDYAAEWTGGEAKAGDDALAAEFVGFREAERRLSWDETRRALARALEIRAGAANPLYCPTKD